MRLPTINEKKYGIDEQLCKIIEEIFELKFAIDNKASLKHILSEAWDVIQATKTLIYVLCEGKTELIHESNYEHCKKLNERAEKGLIGLRGEWTIVTREDEPVRICKDAICQEKHCTKYEICLLKYSVITCDQFRRNWIYDKVKNP
jgi:hypothetical protein